MLKLFDQIVRNNMCKGYDPELTDYLLAAGIGAVTGFLVIIVGCWAFIMFTRYTMTAVVVSLIIGTPVVVGVAAFYKYGGYKDAKPNI